MKWKHPVWKHIGLETGVIALIIGVMTGRVTTGHSLSTEGATVAIEIEDLVVLSIEATIIEITVMAGSAIDAISNMVAEAEANPLGIMVIGIITMVIHITVVIPEVPHQVDMHEEWATNITITIIEADIHGIRIETKIGNSIDMTITTSHILREIITSMVVPQGVKVVIMKWSRTVRFEKFCHK